MMNKLKKAAAKVAIDTKAENDNKKLPDIDKNSHNPFKRAKTPEEIARREVKSPDGSVLGMMYRTRIQQSAQNSRKTVGDKLDTDSSVVGGSSIGSIDIVDSESDSDNEVKQEMNPRQQLAMTIKNWSVMPENDDYIINEGGVHALIALAGLDEPGLKKNCVLALYHLSLRRDNRDKLLDLGAATGVISVATQVRSWKIAKFCALTLCNFSMTSHREGTMAKEGAILALIILMAVKNNRLAPVCGQAMYNLTCTEAQFKGIERIMKALLILPQGSFDFTPYISKGLVNCSRYSWMRSRMIEDGAIAGMSYILQGIGAKENKNELILNVARTIRALTESINCRGDLLQKGCLDILYPILPYCNDESLLLIIKSVHNLLFAVTSMSNSSYELAVKITAFIVPNTNSSSSHQYAAACSHIFTETRGRDNSRLLSLITNGIPRLLDSEEPLTQYYAVSSAGNIFFLNLVEDAEQIKALLVKFVEAGPRITDPAAVQALALAIGKLSQEESYMHSLEILKLFDPLVELLLILQRNHQAKLIQECVCSALCRIALQDKDLSATRQTEIATSLISLLETNDINVLKNAISAIRALGDKGLCHEEFLTDGLLIRAAAIIVEHRNVSDICRMCVASMCVFSFDPRSHKALAGDSVMKELFNMTRSEDSISRELVATTLCNMSMDESARRQMILNGVVDVLVTLSASTSELIQELCAKLICNLTCDVDMQQKMIQDNILQTLLMISLVRAVGSKTKLLCTRALLNLMNESNIPALRASGAIRIFTTISQIDYAEAQLTCAKGFLSFTATDSRREDFCSRRAALTALFNMVKCASLKTRILTGVAICNLLACPSSQRPVINAGGLSALKIVATMDSRELQEATARVIMNLGVIPGLRPILLQASLVQILILILQQPSYWTFECAVYALTCLASSELFRRQLIDDGCVKGLVGVVLAGRLVNVEITKEIAKCLCLLSYTVERAKVICISGNVLLALHAIYRSGLCNEQIAEMLAIIMRNVSEDKGTCRPIIKQHAFELLCNMVETYYNTNIAVFKAAVIVSFNIASEVDIREKIISQGFVTILKKAADLCDAAKTSDESKCISDEDIDYLTKSVNMITQTPSCCKPIAEAGIIGIYYKMFDALSDKSRFEMACSIANMACTKDCRHLLVDQAASELLIQISASTDLIHIQSHCSLALGYLSGITKVNDGIVTSMLQVSLKAEETGQMNKPYSNHHQHHHEKKEETSNKRTFKAVIKQDLMSKNRDDLHHLNTKPLNATNNNKLGSFSDLLLSAAKNLGSEEDFGTLKKLDHLKHPNDQQHITTLHENESMKSHISSHQFVIVSPAIEIQIGGMANPSNVQLPLPIIPSDRVVTSISDKAKIVVGSNVTRGPDWPEGNEEDGGKNAIGIVASIKDNLVQVLWPNGKQGNYKYGVDPESKDQRGKSQKKDEAHYIFHREVIPNGRSSELVDIPIRDEPLEKDMSFNFDALIADDGNDTNEKVAEDKDTKKLETSTKSINSNANDSPSMKLLKAMPGAAWNKK